MPDELVSSRLAPATAGRTLVVDAAGLADANAVKVGPTGAGTAQTARDLGASVLLSAGSGTGQLDFTAGVVKANLAQILGTALTETAGQIAAAFKKFFNVALPVATTESVNQTGDSYARLGAAGAGLTAVPWNAAWDAEVQSEVADALETAIADSVPADGANAIHQANAVYDRSASAGCRCQWYDHDDLQAGWRNAVVHDHPERCDKPDDDDEDRLMSLRDLLTFGLGPSAVSTVTVTTTVRSTSTSHRSMARFLTVTASTKRAPAMAGGKRGVAVTRSLRYCARRWIR